MNMVCIICGGGSIRFGVVSGIEYFNCNHCDSIFADPKFIDGHYSTKLTYNDEYWRFECDSSRDRSYGSTLSRVAEVCLYARKPILKFIDIGTGPGYLLDALSVLMPKYSNRFHGIELFPPPEKFRTKHANFKIGSLSDLSGNFDAGCCIEVIEHLAPTMLRGLIRAMSAVSNAGALYYFNSAQPSFVRSVDPGYLDPLMRGHICIYSLIALKSIFAEFGFTVIPLPGRDWGFLVEFGSFDDADTNVETLMSRVWSPVVQNLDMLKNNGFGPFMYTARLEAARCYYESFSAGQRTQWALTLQEQLGEG